MPVSTTQPTYSFHLENTFAPLGGESVVKTYEFQDGCSDCCGPKITTALTNTRIITRKKQPDLCCGCCKGDFVDTSIFFNDIELMRRYKHHAVNPVVGCLTACLSGSAPCYLIGLCCGCCREKPSVLEVRGAFGIEHLVFTKEDTTSVANTLTALIGPIKSK